MDVKLGLSGMRCMGNILLPEKHHRESFGGHEAQLENSLSKRRIKLLCTYPLERCTGANVLDVIQQHQFTVVRRKGPWKRLGRESSYP